MRSNDVLILGCGMTGVTSALTLKSLNFHVQVVDKGRSYGGRMATRRIDQNQLDHGAQFIEPSKSLEKWLETHAPSDLLKEISTSDEKKRYICPFGMNSLAKKLCETIPTDLNIKISYLKRGSSGWKIRDEEGHEYSAKQILITAPLPQALELLEKNEIEYDKELCHISYRPFIILLANCEDKNLLLHQSLSKPIFEEYYENKSKGLNCKTQALTLICTEDFSRKNYDKTDEEIYSLMQPQLNQHFSSMKINSFQIKKWRYGRPKSFYKCLYYKTKNSGLYLAGDAFGGDSLNGAFRSGVAVSYVIKDDIVI